MGLQDSFSDLYLLISEGTTLGKLTEDTTSRLLTIVADSEVRSAIRLMKDAKTSADPDREKDMALSHLRLAFEKYNDSSLRWNTFHSLPSKLMFNLSFDLIEPPSYTASGKATLTALAIAFLYRMTGDPDQSELFIERAQGCFSRFEDQHRSLFYSTYLARSHWRKRIDGARAKRRVTVTRKKYLAPYQKSVRGAIYQIRSVE